MAERYDNESLAADALQRHAELNGGVAMAISFRLTAKMVVYVHHAHNHGAARIERQLLEAPSFIEATHAVIERMRDHANAANGLGCAQGGFERKPQEVRGVALSLIILVYGELAEQYGRHGIGRLRCCGLGRNARSMCAALKVT